MPDRECVLHPDTSIRLQGTVLVHNGLKINMGDPQEMQNWVQSGPVSERLCACVWVCKYCVGNQV